MKSGFRFGGRGGHKYKGSITSSLGGKYRFEGKFNQKELEKLMKDIGPEAEQKIKTAIRKGNDEVIKHLKQWGRNMTQAESNRAYNKITKDLQQTKKHDAFRIEMNADVGGKFGPAGRKKKGGRGKRLTSLHLLYRAPVPAWYYADEIYRGMRVPGSSNFGKGIMAPLRFKKRGRKKKYPGIKMSQTMDWVAMAEHMAPPIIVDKIEKALRLLVNKKAKATARQLTKGKSVKLKKENTGVKQRIPLRPAPIEPGASGWVNSVVSKYKGKGDIRRRGA